MKSDIFLDCVDRSRDLGIVFGTFCRPGRREKEIVRIDDLSRFGHRVWQPLRPRRREKKSERIDDVSRFGHSVWRLCRPRRREKEDARIDDLSRFGHRVREALST